MGFRLRKSFKVGGGFRVNLSRRGVGASWGVPGFRVGIGPSGTRAHFSIPGTGLGWSGGLGAGSRHVAAGASGQQFDAAPRWSPSGPVGPAYGGTVVDRNLAEVQEHERHLSALVTLHLESWRPWNWHAVAASAPPVPPARTSHHEERARRALAEFNPGALGKLLGGDARRRQLEDDLVRARQTDDEEHEARKQAHLQERARWEWFRNLARDIVEGSAEACQAAVDYLGPFATFQALGSSLNVQITRTWCVEAWLVANGRSAIPLHTKTLTATGRVSVREMSDKKWDELYQDHVCSAALRIARELFALLPLPYVLVHVARPMTIPSTGQQELWTVLSVAFEREMFDTLNLEAIDPSDSMQVFEHRMHRKRADLMLPVEPLSPADLFEDAPE